MMGRRRWVVVAGLLAVALAGSDTPKKADETPPTNAKVAAYVKAQLGRMIGDGECSTLAVAALRSAGAQPGWFGDPRGDYTWGRLIKDLKDVKPGDILQFRDAVFAGKTTTGRTTVAWRSDFGHHTAVVAKVEQDGQVITIHHQNAAAQGEPNQVREDELRMDALQPGGWIKAYRPVPMGGTAAAGSSRKPKPEPLPPLNAKVAEFAKSNLGKPVGDGICITLAVEALREAGAAPGSFANRNGDYTWGQPVDDLKQTLPGDILQFRDAVFQGRRPTGKGYTTWHYEYPHHTAVVAKVEQGGRIITIYHQNVSVKGEKDDDKGNVREGELRMDSLQKGGWVKAYRPVELESR